MRNKDLAEVCGFGEILNLIFQKWLVTVAVRTENLAVVLVFLQRFSGSIVAYRGLITNIVSENLCSWSRLGSWQNTNGPPYVLSFGCCMSLY